MPRTARAWLLFPAATVFAGLFVLPLLYMFVISFWTVRARMMRPGLSLANYVEALTDYGGVLAYTALIACIIALVTTAIAFAFAYAMRFRLGRFANAFLLITLTTLFGGYLVKIYAWKSILGTEGVLNQMLIGLGIIEAPLGALLYSTQGVVITLTYFLLPFAVLPIYGSLRSIRDVTIEAARDVGAGPVQVLVDIILPQCRGGLMTAFTLSFLISIGDYVTPRFVGGGAALMGTFIESQFSIGFNWPLGSAMAFLTMAVTLMIVLVANHCLERALRP